MRGCSREAKARAAGARRLPRWERRPGWRRRVVAWRGGCRPCMCVRDKVPKVVGQAKQLQTHHGPMCLAFFARTEPCPPPWPFLDRFRKSSVDSSSSSSLSTAAAVCLLARLAAAGRQHPQDDDAVLSIVWIGVCWDHRCEIGCGARCQSIAAPLIGRVACALLAKGASIWAMRQRPIPLTRSQPNQPAADCLVPTDRGTDCRQRQAVHVCLSWIHAFGSLGDGSAGAHKKCPPPESER